MKQRPESKMKCFGSFILAAAGLALLAHMCRAQPLGLTFNQRAFRDGTNLSRPLMQDDSVKNPIPPAVGYNTTTKLTQLQMQSKERSAPNIVNGELAAQGEFPFICTLELLVDGFWFFICGSTIFNEKTLITAAHCVFGDMDGEYRAVCGNHDLVETDPGEVTKRIIDVRIHEDYEDNSLLGFPNDIAVLKLDSPLVFSRQISRLEIHDGVKPIPRLCYIIGWGITEEGTVSVVLRKAVMRRVSNRYCSHRWASPLSPDPINSGHICVITPDKRSVPRSAACSGDSGSPVVCGQYMVGILSWGSAVCDGEFPGAYTRLFFFQCWLRDNAFL